MTHVLNVAHGIGAGVACAACFYLAGLVLTPRRWDELLRGTVLPILGAALYVLLCWIAISAQHIPLTTVAYVFVGGVLALSVLRIRRVVASVRAASTSRTLRSGMLVFVLFYILVYLMTRPPASDIFLPPAWSGSPDLLTHVRYAKHLLNFGSPDLDAASFDYLRSPAVSHLLAGFSLAFNQDPLSAAMPAQFALVALIAVAVVGVCRSVFALPMLTAIAVACIFVTNPYFRHVASTYQLPVLTTVPLLLFLLWFMIRARSSPVVAGPLVATLASAYVLLFFTDTLTLFAALTLQAALFPVFMASGQRVRGLVLSSVMSASIVVVAFGDRVRWSFDSFQASNVLIATMMTLGIVLLASVASIVRRDDILGRFARTPTDRRLAVSAISYSAMALIAGNVAVHAVREPVPLRMPGSWRGIEQLQNLHFGELTLKIDYDPRGLLTAVTRYFLPDKKLHVIAPRVRVRDLPFETISRQSPMLIQNFGCEGVGHAAVTTIPHVGCFVFAPPALELDRAYPFNRTFLSLGVDGMTDREAGGRWNIGRRLSLRLAVDPEQTGVGRDLYVNFFVTPFLPPAVKPPRLIFIWGSNRTGEAAIATQGWVSVPISASDWSGNRIWRLPISIAFPDGRTILFHDLSVSEKPRGPVVQ